MVKITEMKLGPVARLEKNYEPKNEASWSLFMGAHSPVKPMNGPTIVAVEG